MLYKDQTETDFQTLKTNSFIRFERHYKKIAMKEIKLDNMIVCYISSLYETEKIVFDKEHELIVTNNIYASDITEIELLKNQIEKGNKL